MNSIILTSLLFSSFYSGGACYPFALPHRTLVGVNVIDTQIVRDAISYAQGYEDNSVFNHSMRSWIFGSIIINKNPAYSKIVDEEVHALGTILHDVGLDPKIIHGEDIDPLHGAAGGKAVRTFLANNTEGKLWTPSRIQLLVDAVTLHLEDSDSTKPVEIRAVRNGQQIDLSMGPSGFVTAAEYNAIVAAYPLGAMKDHVSQGGMMPKNSGDHGMSSAPGGHSMSSMPGGHTMSSTPGGHSMSSAPGGHSMSSMPEGHSMSTTPGGHSMSSGPGDHMMSSGTGGHMMSA
jgi:hypothetical protein